MVDEWGGIDEGIQDIVSALNALGITTTGSCEGHVDRPSSPAPWVKVTAPHKPNDIAHDLEAYRNWQLENERIRKKTLELLNEFYSDRDVAPDVRIVIGDANAGFWIHNGGDAYDRWRELVAETVAKIQRGEKIRGGISAEERECRTQTLPQYQKEMETFTDFLKTKLSI